MSDNGISDAISILLTRDRTTKANAATVISKTSVDQYALQFFVGFVRELGWRCNVVSILFVL